MPLSHSLVLVSPQAQPPLHFHIPLSLPNQQLATARSLIGVAMTAISRRTPSSCEVSQSCRIFLFL